MQRIKDSFNWIKHKYDVIENFLDEHYIYFAWFIIIFNALSCIFVILRVPYTEIDWIAYMQQVSSVINDRQFDYLKLRGDTGPLVYPAGFVYIYSILYWATNEGRNVRRAQWIFAVIYVLVTVVVLGIYREVCGKRHGSTCPVWIVVLLVLSKRIMSLFVLRMFNDGIEALFMYIAVWLFVKNRWGWGCIWYSLAVSIKMNALLYAPAVMVLLCYALGIGKAVMYVITLCGGIQVLTGFPFLCTYPKSYLMKAFELNRVFEFKWSVNGAFWREKVFLSKRFALIMLVLHLSLLLLFGHCRWTSQGLFKMLQTSGLNGRSWWAALRDRKQRKLRAGYIVSTLFACNLIGIACARTLHYQFYLWYFHTLPFLMWTSRMPTLVRFKVLFGIEYIFNVYPPLPEASLALHLCHLLLLNDSWERPRVVDQSIFVHEFRDSQFRDSHEEDKKER